MRPSPPVPPPGAAAAPTLLVGCGYLGSHWLARVAARPGPPVWVLARRPRPLPPFARGLWADLTAPDLERRLARALGRAPLHTVIWCVAPDHATAAAYRQLYVAATARLVGWLAARPQPPERWIFTSSTGVWGHDDGRWVAEDAPVAPRGWRGELMVEAEAQLPAPGPAALTTRLRLGGLYGPGRLGLRGRVQQGWWPAEQRFTNRIHRDDAATLLEALRVHPQPPAVLTGCDDAPALMHEVAQALADQLGLPPRPAPPPGPPGGKRCHNHRLGRLGVALAFPSFREGYGLAPRPASEGPRAGSAGACAGAAGPTENW